MTTFREDVEALMETIEDAKYLADAARQYIKHAKFATSQMNGCIQRLETVLEELEQWKHDS